MFLEGNNQLILLNYTQTINSTCKQKHGGKVKNLRNHNTVQIVSNKNITHLSNDITDMTVF